MYIKDGVEGRNIVRKETIKNHRVIQIHRRLLSLDKKKNRELGEIKDYEVLPPLSYL